MILDGRIITCVVVCPLVRMGSLYLFTSLPLYRFTSLRLVFEETNLNENIV